MTLFLDGLGLYHPGNAVTNRFLEALDVGTSDAWILERVGIRSRRAAPPLDDLRGGRNWDVHAANEAGLRTNAEPGRAGVSLRSEACA